MAKQTPKKKRGRPTKYNVEMIKKVDEYLEQCSDVYNEFHKTRGEKSNSFERLIKVNLPTVYAFSKYVGVNKDTLYEWAKVHKDFSVALDKIAEAQKERLLENGLSGQYNSTIAKLILSSNHGMAEKTQTDITSDGKPIEGFNYVKPNDPNDKTDT